MANIKCKACGRRYSYHASDLCPHCGAYNRPQSRMRVGFDEAGNAELLNEQQFQRQSEANRRNKAGYEDAASFRDETDTPDRGGVPVSRGIKAGLVAAAIAMAVVMATFVVIGAIGSFRAVGHAEVPAEVAAAAPDEMHVVEQMTGEPFVIDDDMVLVEAVYVADDRLYALVRCDDDDIAPELELYTAEDQLWSSPWGYEHIKRDDQEYWLISYESSGIHWADTIGAYLVFADYEERYMVRVDITDTLLPSVVGQE